MNRAEAIGIANKFNDTIFTNTPEFVEALQILLADSETIERIGGVFPAKEHQGKYLIIVNGSNSGIVFVPYESTSDGDRWDEPIRNAVHATLDQCLHAQVKLCEDCKAERERNNDQ